MLLLLSAPLKAQGPFFMSRCYENFDLSLGLRNAQERSFRNIRFVYSDATRILQRRNQVNGTTTSRLRQIRTFTNIRREITRRLENLDRAAQRQDRLDFLILGPATLTAGPDILVASPPLLTASPPLLTAGPATRSSITPRFFPEGQPICDDLIEATDYVLELVRRNDRFLNLTSTQFFRARQIRQVAGR